MGGVLIGAVFLDVDVSLGRFVADSVTFHILHFLGDGVAWAR